MNYIQMQYLCGIDSNISINLINGNTVKGTLASIYQDGVKVLTDIGSLRDIKNEEITDIRSFDMEKKFYTPEITQEAQRSQGIANTLVNQNPMKFYQAFKETISCALDTLKPLASPEAKELANILHTPDEIKRQCLTVSDIKEYIELTEQIFSRNRDLCRCIQFLLWYGAGCTYKAMTVLTADLMQNDTGNSDELYKQLGIANHMMGKIDAMTLYWLGKYYQKNPEHALSGNELCCSGLWIAYLDLSCDMLYFERIPEILIHLAQNGGEAGKRCAYFSLYRLFSRGGSHALSRESIAALLPECGMSKLARSVPELTVYLKSDMDGHCFFAAEAADAIVRTGITHYADTAKDFCCGYLYDYTATKHHGRILGFDLVTYFLPSSVVPAGRKKEIKKGFNLSQYNGNRTLMEPVVFHAEVSFRRGNSYTVTELC